jgi:uncharacterized membrane protein (DUF2068 family)
MRTTAGRNGCRLAGCSSGCSPGFIRCPGPEFVRKRAPTLYAIIAIKLVKGVLLLLLAVGVYTLADDDLVQDYRAFLGWMHVDPERQFFSDLAAKIRTLTPANVVSIASGTAFYSLFSLVEGVGLAFRFFWAGYLAIGESAFFVPIEIYKLLDRFSVTVVVILILNIIIVWYLFANRHRLFRHHHHHAQPALRTDAAIKSQETLHLADNPTVAKPATQKCQANSWPALP